MNSAHDPLEKVKDILRDFLKNIEEIQSIHKNMSAPQMALAFTVADRMPIFDAAAFLPAPTLARTLEGLGRIRIPVFRTLTKL